MKLYEAVFSNGIAKIIEVKTGREAIIQPYNPTDVGNVPWQNEEEALSWLHKYHEGFLLLEEIEIVQDDNSDQEGNQ